MYLITEVGGRPPHASFREPAVAGPEWATPQGLEGSSLFFQFLVGPVVRACLRRGLTSGVNAPKRSPAFCRCQWVSSDQMSPGCHVSRPHDSTRVGPDEWILLPPAVILQYMPSVSELPRHRHAILSMGCGHRVRIACRTADVQTFIFCIRSRKYSFQSSGKAAICKARRKDASSSVPHRFKTYNRVISQTGTAFASREITVIASPTPTSPSRVTAK